MKKFGFIAILALLSIGGYFFVIKNKSDSTVSRPVKLQNRIISSESQLSKIDQDILNVKDRIELKLVFKKIIEEAKNTPASDNNLRGAQLKLYSSVIYPAAHLEAIIWRLRKIAKQSGYIHYNAIQFISRAYYQNNLYGEHINQILDFFVHPPVGDNGIIPKKDLNQFENIQSFQIFAKNTLKPSLLNAIKQIDQLVAQTSNGGERPSLDWSFDLNPNLFAGNNIFSEQSKTRFHGSYIYYLRSIYNRTLALIEIFSAYNLDDTLKILNSFVKETAFDNIFRENGLPEVLTPKQMIPIINYWPQFLTSTTNNKNDYYNKLKTSLNYYEESVLDEKASYEYAVSISTTGNIFNTEILKINEKDKRTKFNEILNVINAAKNNKSYDFIDIRSGKTITINPGSILSLSTDLKDYLPNKFNTTGSRSAFKKEGRTKLNYNYGQPIGWPDPSFNGFLGTRNSDEVYEYINAMKLEPALDFITNFFPVP